MESRFLQLSPVHHEMMLLLTLHWRDGLAMPIDPADVPSAALDQVSLARLLDDGVLAISGPEGARRIALTADGQDHLRRLVVDHHLELMELRRASDDFVAERVAMLERRGCRRIALYGASDTAQVLLESLKQSAIDVLIVIDDDPAKQGQSFGGVPVTSLPAALELAFDSIVVTTVAFQDVILRDRASAIPPGKQLIGLFDDFQS